MKIEDYNKYYIQGSDHYLIPKDEFKELFNEMINWKEESQKQKEVIDKAIELLNNPWSFESGNKEVDEITYNKKRKVIDILNEVSEWNH